MALGIAQMAGATAGGLLLLTSGVMPAALVVATGTMLLTAVSMLLFGGRRAGRRG